MDIKKLSFDVSDVELLKEDPESNLSILSLDFFASGQNLHDLYVSEKTLFDTADTIKNCPVVWKYDKIYDDASTHGPDQNAIGFVPESAEIKSRKLDDGRIMLSTIAYVWKKYSGKILDIFKRDKNFKPVSVEMTVLETGEENGRSQELLSYKFDAITVLSSLVRPAIPNAGATLVQFSEDSKEFKEIIKQEFSKYNAIDFSIPKKVKSNSQKGLDLYREYGFGANSVSLSVARHMVKNEKATPEKVRHVSKSFKGRKFENIVRDPPSAEYITFLLYGGKDGKEWSENISMQLEEADRKTLSYFSNEGEKSLKKEEINVEDEKKVEEEPKEEMAVETPEEEKKEDPKEEAKETEQEEKDEEKKEKMSLDANLDHAAALAFLKSETEDYTELVAEFSEGGSQNYAKLAYALYTKAMALQEMCGRMAAEKEEMCGKFAAEEEKNKAYMTENDELKKFKADFEAKQFETEVNYTLKSIQESVDMPKEEMSMLYEEAKKFSLETIDAFKNMAKAKAFGFAVKGKKSESETVKYALPWVPDTDSKKASSPWVR